jgi:MFS transporter, PPP family, 3-phenylpropionic acid transporter
VLPATRFSWLFATQFFALGAAMPFVPVALANGGLSPQWVGLVLAVGTAVRLVMGLLSARMAELIGVQTVLVAGSIVAGLTLPGLALVEGVFLLLVVQLVHGMAIAPIVPLSDAAAVAEMRRRSFDYGQVRAWGSVAFIIGAVMAGQCTEWGGPIAALSLAGMALLATSIVANGVVPQLLVRPTARVSLWAPLRVPGFPRLLMCSALIQSSHVVYYGFSALHWREAGISPAVIGALWAWGVLAEVLLFFFGRRLADRLGPRGLAMLAGVLGMVRWLVTGTTVDVSVLFVTQTLHAATFGAMHLAAIRAMATLPPRLGPHAQSLHSALGVGLASGLLMLAAGPLYAALEGGAFLVMSGICGLGLVAAAGLLSRLPAGQIRPCDLRRCSVPPAPPPAAQPAPDKVSN